jgi:hypothetical protein
VAVDPDALTKVSACHLALGQLVILDVRAIPVDPAGFGMPGQPLRRGHGEGVERGPQRLAPVRQAVELAHHHGQHVSGGGVLPSARLQQTAFAIPRQHGVEQDRLETTPGATHELAAEAQPVSGSAFSLGKGVISRALVMDSECDDSNLLI